MLDPWDNRPPLPSLDSCTYEQREAIQMALCYGVVAHGMLLRTARGSGVRLFVATVAGLGRKRRCPTTPEYQLGMERYLRVEGQRRVLCECPLGQRGKPCAHAGATWIQLLR
jgi:hypothetical protein